MFSLVSAPVLGFDLIRRDGGHRVAAVLRRALTVEAVDLPGLAAVHLDDPDRDAAWVALSAGTRDSIRDLGAALAENGETTTQAGVRTALRQLARAPIGTLEGLLTCVRTDVFGWTWRTVGDLSVQDEPAARAVAVVCDAVAACYAGDEVDAAYRRRLAGPWTQAERRIPERAPDLGPSAADVTGLLTRARHLDAGDLAALRTAAEHGVRGPEWSSAVHEASWAVHLSGRVRPAAAAQFALVESLHAAELPLADAAGGTWNLLSGALQAVMVRDLLPTDTTHRLLAPVIQAIGIGWAE
ncbi:MAG TPA: hypothetical protein VGD11_09960 [Mycobacteriales bacterium]